MSATNRERSPAPNAAMGSGSEPAVESFPKHLEGRLETRPSASAAMRVRAARFEDLPHIVAVLIASFYPHIEATQWFYWLMRIGIREDIKTRLKTASDQYACLVAVAVDSAAAKLSSQTPLPAAGKVIGTIEISQRPCETWRFFPPRRAYLSNLAIDRTHRRQGAAKQLLHTCETVALRWGFHCTYLHVMANNQAARSLYIQAGYQPCEVSNPILAGLGIRPERLLMSKQLPSDGEP